MKLFKKGIISILCGAICLLGVACGQKPTTKPDDGPIGEVDGNKQITLRIESAAPLKSNYQALLRSEAEGTQLYNQALFTKRLVDGFKKKYSNVKLQFIEDGWGDALFQAQQLYIRDYNAGGKMAVDIMIGETYMGYFAENGVFARLDKEKFSDVIDGACADVTIDGERYGVPMCTGIMGLQYNTNILSEAGIAEEKWVPSTWAELLENCRIVSEYAEANNKSYGGIVMNNVAGMSGAFRATPFLRAAGGDILDSDGKLAINSESNIEAFEYLRDLAQYAYEDSLTCDNEDTLQYYFTNKNYGAYMIEGQWSMASAPDNIKSAPLPAKNADGTGRGNIYCGNVLFGVTNASENKAAAQAFLEYLTSSEVQSWFYELDGRLPVSKTMLESEEILTIHPNINSYIKELVAGGFDGGLSCFVKNANDIWSLWGSFYSNVLTSATDIKTLADKAQADIGAKI